MSGANTHIHLPPNYSAFHNARQAVELATIEGIGILGVSNYYDFGVYADFEQHCLGSGITPLFGLEIVVRIPELAEQGVRVNDPANPGKMYLCGKGLRGWKHPSSVAARLLDRIGENDRSRMRKMITRLAGVFATAGIETGLDETAVVDMVVRHTGCPRHTVVLQERHVAQAFQEAMYRVVPPGESTAALRGLFGLPVCPDNPSQVAGAIRNRLMKAGKPAFVEETYIGFDDAMHLIAELGGIPCYPVLADGARPVCEYESDIEALIADLRARGINHAEFIPGRNSPEALRQYVLALHDAGISISAGTEHNTPELSPLTPAGPGGVPIPDNVQAIFDEGAKNLVAT